MMTPDEERQAGAGVAAAAEDLARDAVAGALTTTEEQPPAPPTLRPPQTPFAIALWDRLVAEQHALMTSRQQIDTDLINATAERDRQIAEANAAFASRRRELDEQQQDVDRTAAVVSDAISKIGVLF